jgi:hypothetical protein
MKLYQSICQPTNARSIQSKIGCEFVLEAARYHVVLISQHCGLIIKSFIYPTNAQSDCYKRILKFTLIFTLKVLLHVSV